MKARILIVDDEPLARERLLKFLRDEPEVEIVGEAGNGREAVEQIQKLDPDVVFLDVQMPELDGFDVVAELSPPLPAIVFVTAHDKFALRAFEIHAVDYLLKPFDRERLKTALARALSAARQKHPRALDEKFAALLNSLKPRAETPERLPVKSEGRVVFVNVEDIDWVEAADNYVNLHVGKESHLLRETMTNLAGKLPSKKFLRISRSTLVNVERIKELQPLFHGEYVVILRDGTKLTLSRSHRDKLDQLGL